MLNHDKGYTAGESAVLIERAPAYIARMGQIVTPELPANGKGYRSYYSFRNLIEMQLAEELAGFGVPQKKVQHCITALRHSRCKWLEENGEDGWLVIDRLWRWGAGTTVEIALRSLSIPSPIPSFLTVNILTMKQKLRDKILEVE